MPRPVAVLDQDELERWVGDGEVGVAGLSLGRFGPEELGVEVDASSMSETLSASWTRATGDLH